MGRERHRNERVSRWLDSSWEEKGLYEDGLPPVSHDLEVVTVVPVYREFSDGTLWRMIEDATNQNIPASKFEILLVVNNSVTEARKKTEAYVDNQKLLYFLGTLREAIQAYTNDPRPKILEQACDTAFEMFLSAGIKLDDSHRIIFRKAVQKRLRMHGIDASSEDRVAHEPDDGLNAIGVARHIGSKVAARRYRDTKIGTKGLIDFIDADCGFPPNYYQELIAAGASNESADAFAKELRTYAPSIPEWKHQKPLQRLASLLNFLRQNITYRRDRYSNTGIYWSPQPVVRAAFLESIGGYVYEGINEDIFFGRVVHNKTKPVQVTKTHVRLSDRESDRGVDGQGMGAGSKSRSEDGKTFAAEHDPENIESLGGEDYTYFAREVLGYDLNFEGDQRYRTIRARRWKQEVDKSKARVAVLRQVVHVVVQKITAIRPNLETFTKDANYRAWLKKHFGKSLSPEILEYLAENPIIMAALVTASKMIENDKDRKALGINEGTTEQMAWQFFETYLPEFFTVLPDQEPDYDALRAGLDKGKLPPGYSLRSLAHLTGAQHEYRAQSGR